MKSGEIVKGAFLGMLAGGPAAEFMAGQGMDFFILDLEHYTFDTSTVREMIAVARQTGISPLIRIAEPTPDVTKWLDAGAEGIVLPNVQSKKVAQDLVKYGRYPPEGERGASTFNGHTDFRRLTNVPAFLAQQNRDVLLLAMIESPKGLAIVDQILSVPGIDGSIMGTGDFAQALGLPGQPDHPDVWKQADRFIAACRARKKITSVPIRKPDDVAHWMKAGLNVLTFVDISMISQGFQLNFAKIPSAPRPLTNAGPLE
jgi:2-keto-3-deoxy-L-rhamnonate aldolase RhmA